MRARRDGNSTHQTIVSGAGRMVPRSPFGCRPSLIAVATLALAACSPPPPIVSADTSCERFAHISATDAQIKVFQDNWDVMETYADQAVAHNVEYDKSCLGPVKP